MVSNSRLANSALVQFLLKVAVETISAALVYGSVYKWVVRFLDPSVQFVWWDFHFTDHIVFLFSAYIISGYWLVLFAVAVGIKLFFSRRVLALIPLLTLAGALFIGCSIAVGPINNITLSVAISTLLGSIVVLIVYTVIFLKRRASK
jgi:hypothetical protein